MKLAGVAGGMRRCYAERGPWEPSAEAQGGARRARAVVVAQEATEVNTPQGQGFA